MKQRRMVVSELIDSCLTRRELHCLDTLDTTNQQVLEVLALILKELRILNGTNT